MMKWSVLIVISCVGCVYSAPLFGASGNVNAQSGDPNNSGLTANMRGPGGQISAETKLKHFKGTLYLFAPQSWIDTFNAIPEAGQTCMLSAFSDPANTALATSTDTEAAKQLVQSKCPENAAQINSFFDAAQTTIKSLPEQFVNNLKSYGEQAKQLGEQFKQQMSSGAASGAQAASAGANAGAEQFKQRIAQFSKITADFFTQLSSLSQENRQQIATAFPKLSTFIVGPNSDSFLKGLTELYNSMSNGQLDANSIRTQGQQLKTALTAVWNDYKSANADALQQASQLFGKDLTNAFQSDQLFGGMNGGGFNAGGSSGVQSGGINSRTDFEAKRNAFQANWEEKKNEIGNGIQNSWDNAKENVASGIEKAKEAHQNVLNHFNDPQAQDNGSVEKDGPSEENH